MSSINAPILSLPTELLQKIESYLSPKDLRNFHKSIYEDEPTQDSFHYYIGKYEKSNNSSYTDKKILDLVDNFCVPPSKPCTIPPSQSLNSLQTMRKRLHFIGTGSKGVRHLGKIGELQEHIKTIKDCFTPKVPIELRNRRWCIWQISNLLKQYKDQELEYTEKSTEDRLDALGITNPFAKGAYKIFLWFDSVSFKYFSHDPEIEALKAVHIEDLSSTESVVIGNLSLHNKEHRVLANFSSDATRINILLENYPEPNNQSHIAHFETVFLINYDPSRSYNFNHRLYAIREGYSNWENFVAKRKSLPKYSLEATLYLMDPTKDFEPSYRLIDLKITQIVLELFLKTPNVDTISLKPNYDDGLVLGMSVPMDIHKDLRSKIEQFDRENQDLIFPQFDEESFFQETTYHLDKKQLSSYVPILHKRTGKTWVEIIKNDNIITEDRVTIPLFYKAPPHYLEMDAALV